MVGALFLAAGVPDIFERRPVGRRWCSATSSCGSRWSALWLRAARRPPRAARDRAPVRRGASASCRCCGSPRLGVPEAWLIPSFFLLVGARAAVPVLAEQAARTRRSTRTTSPSATGCSRSSCSASVILLGRSWRSSRSCRPERRRPDLGAGAAHRRRAAHRVLAVVDVLLARPRQHRREPTRGVAVRLRPPAGVRLDRRGGRRAGGRRRRRRG